LQNLPVSVRIGQSVDVVGKAGNPKSIVGGHVQTTPVLLCAGEKAELASDQYESLSGVLEGFVILREKVSPQRRAASVISIRDLTRVSSCSRLKCPPTGFKFNVSRRFTFDRRIASSVRYETCLKKTCARLRV